METTDSTPSPRSTSGSIRFLLWGVLVALSFLPVANWIRGGYQAAWYSQAAGDWANGTAIAVGLGIICAVFSQRFPLWRDGLFTRIAEVAISRRHTVAIVLFITALSTYSAVALFVFDGRPLLIDELVQVMQSRVFASGQLVRPAPLYPEFESTLNVIDFGGRWYSQFPPGGPGVIALGSLFGVAWIVGPICGAAAAVAFWYLALRVEERAGVVFTAALLFAFAPFALFMSGSHMNHVPTLLWSVLALLSLAQLLDKPVGSLRSAFICGLCLGLAASTRPLDAIALALPVAGLLVLRAVRQPVLARDVVAAGLGTSLPVAFVLYYNYRTTGSPFLFGYELLWGKSHALGFHRAPWGVAHTPARGLELVNLYLLRLQTYLFEAPVPSLAPILIALILCRRFCTMDRVMLWAAFALLIGYFSYWHDGFYLGPRFLYPLLPVLALWASRFLPELSRLTRRDGLVYRSGVFAVLAAVVIAMATAIPVRVQQYKNWLASMRLDYTGPARRAGVQNALILVRESWGSQLVARLWMLGVPRSETEILYRNIDTCVLELAVRRLESSASRDSVAMRELEPLLQDSARLVRTELSPDHTERMLAGSTYPALCVRRIMEDRSGFTLLAPLHVMDQGTNLYVRDLHARDTLLLAAYPARSIYLLVPSSSAMDASLELKPVFADSLRRAWAEDALTFSGTN